MDDNEIRSLPTTALLARALELSREEEAKFREGFYEKESPEERDRRRLEITELQRHCYELDRRATDDVFEQAMAWTKSADPVERELAAYLLSRAGEMAEASDGNKRRRTAFFARAESVLEAMLDEEDPYVLTTVVSAFSYNSTPEPVLRRVDVLTHDSADVKVVLTSVLGDGILGGIDVASCVQHLLRLMEDVDDDVRDWATFHLGELSDEDSEEIRAAFVRRLTDSHEDTRKEAIMGLARRVDDRVIPVIVEELRSDSVWRSVVEAAGIHGSAEFIEPLKELRPWWDVDEKVLEEAIRNCQGGEHTEESFMSGRLGRWTK